MNDNQVRVYDSTSGAPVYDPDQLLDRAEQIRFSTIYPGGIFESASFFMPCDPTRFIPFKWVQKITIMNGLNTLWIGLITQITLVTDAQRTGIEIGAIGHLAFWNYSSAQRRWIDRRYSSDVYGVWYLGVYPATEFGNHTKLNQENQLLLNPFGTWGNYETSYVLYKTDRANKIARVKFSYDVGVQAESSPIRAKIYDSSAGTYTANLTEIIDGSAASSYNIQPDTGDYLYIGFESADKVSGLKLELGAAVNNNVSALTVEYYGVDSSWHTVTQTDGTDIGGASLAQSGNITFTEFDGWGLAAINGSTSFYYLRLSWSALTDVVNLATVYMLRDQAWTMFFNDIENEDTLWSTTTTGTGTQDLTFATTSNYIGFGMTSNAGQEVVGSGIYGKITDLVVFGANAAGNAVTTVREILLGIMADLGYTDSTFIAANTYDMTDVGFVADDNTESTLRTIQRLLNYSTANDAYSFGFNEYEQMYYEIQPVLTDYDYIVSLSDQELSGVELVLSADFGELYNNIQVSYTDDAGKLRLVTATDDAGLSDATSAAKYLARSYLANAGVSSSSGAIDYGKRLLKSKKDLQYYMRGPLQIKGKIHKKDGSSVSVSQVRAGQRVRLKDFSTDIGDVIGAGLTFLISRTEYDDESGVMSITTGVGDDLAQYLAWREATGK